MLIFSKVVMVLAVVTQLALISAADSTFAKVWIELMGMVTAVIAWEVLKLKENYGSRFNS